MKEHFENEKCPVCGDKVSGYHYGLLTCESCKGFFKRTVQNGKKYSCVNTRSCLIDKTQRKGCQFCRYQKCILVGMRIEAVRRDRMRGGRNAFGPLYKQDRVRKKKLKDLNEFHRNLGEDLKDENHFTPSLPLWPEAFAPEFTPKHDVMPPHSHAAMTSQSLPTYNATMLPQPYRMNILLPNASDIENRASQSGLRGRICPQVMFGDVPYNFTRVNGSWCEQQQHATEQLDRYLNSLEFGPVERSVVTLQPKPMTSLLDNLIKCEPPEHEMRERILKALGFLPLESQRDIFTIAAVVADQSLYTLVDWAKKTSFFGRLDIVEQMKLLQSCWVELMALDHIYRQVTFHSDDIILPSGHTFPSVPPSKEPTLVERILRKSKGIEERFESLKMDYCEFVCMKYLILFNAESRNEVCEQMQDQVNEALCAYASRNRQNDRVGKLLFRLSEVRSLAILLEEYLQTQLDNNNLPENTLLIEMMRAKHAVR